MAAAGCTTGAVSRFIAGHVDLVGVLAGVAISCAPRRVVGLSPGNESSGVPLAGCSAGALPGGVGGCRGAGPLTGGEFERGVCPPLMRSAAPGNFIPYNEKL